MSRPDPYAGVLKLSTDRFRVDAEVSTDSRKRPTFGVEVACFCDLRIGELPFAYTAGNPMAFEVGQDGVPVDLKSIDEFRHRVAALVGAYQLGNGVRLESPLNLYDAVGGSRLGWAVISHLVHLLQQLHDVRVWF